MVSSSSRLLITLAVLWTAVPAIAQTSDPAELARLLKTGDTITIFDLNGAETRGKVERVVDGMLEFHQITQGTTPDSYRMAAEIARFSLDQIAAVSRLAASTDVQTPLYQRSDSFASLHRRLNLGQVVRVTQRNGDETVGKVTEVSPKGLVIALRKENPRDGSGRPRIEWDGPRSFAPTDVEKITREAHIWDGAVKGALIALASVLIIGHDCLDCNGIGSVLALSTGIGAGIGLGIDAAIPARTIYRRR